MQPPNNRDDERVQNYQKKMMSTKVNSKDGGQSVSSDRKQSVGTATPKEGLESSGCNLMSQDLDEQQNMRSASYEGRNNHICGVVPVPVSTHSSLTMKYNDWEHYLKPCETEAIEFEKNEVECLRITEQPDSKYTSAISNAVNAVQQIKFD